MTISIAEHLKETAATQLRMAAQAETAEDVAQIICKALHRGNKVVVFGNGGSAADAQHFAAELIGRFETERQALPAIALTTDTSVLTALANDYSFDFVFARQVRGLVREGDVVVGLSTSGNSKSVLEAMVAAKELCAYTVGITGSSGGKLKSVSDACLCVPSQRTAHIQECTIALIHAICARIDAAFQSVTA